MEGAGKTGKGWGEKIPSPEITWAALSKAAASIRAEDAAEALAAAARAAVAAASALACEANGNTRKEADARLKNLAD